MIERICPECNKTFKIPAERIRHGRGKYCSVACRSSAKTGAKNPRWRGGQTKKSVTDWQKRNPEKRRAQNRLRQAVFDGRVIKGPCAVCGTTENVQGHHEDYSKPFDVVWLCHKHHCEAHGR